MRRKQILVDKKKMNREGGSRANRAGGNGHGFGLISHIEEGEGRMGGQTDNSAHYSMHDAL